MRGIAHMAVDLLEGDRAGRECCPAPRRCRGGFRQPLAHAALRGARADHAGLDHERPARRRLDHRISRHVQTGVDPHHAAGNGNKPRFVRFRGDHGHPGHPSSDSPVRETSSPSCVRRLRIGCTSQIRLAQRLRSAPARAVGPVLQGHAQLGEPVANFIGQPEVLLLAKPGAEVDQETRSRAPSEHLPTVGPAADWPAGTGPGSGSAP